jgi:hypothetical protein
MQVNLPPIIPYIIGFALIVFGGLRIKFLGAPRARCERDTDLQEPSGPPREDVIERGPEQRRHIRWGIIWILLGAFVVISTYLQTRRHG